VEGSSGQENRIQDEKIRKSLCMFSLALKIVLSFRYVLSVIFAGSLIVFVCLIKVDLCYVLAGWDLPFYTS